MEEEEGTLAHPPPPSTTTTTNNNNGDASSSAPIHIASTLKKKTRLGLWHKRYFELNGDQLLYSKSEATRDTPLLPPMKVEYCQLDGRFGALVLQTEQREFVLQAASLDEAQRWVVCVEQAEAEADRVEMLREFHASKATTTTTSASGTTTATKQDPMLTPMEGYLQIRSASRVKGWKDGFFRLEPCMLVYYKTNLHAKEDYESQIVFSAQSTVERKQDKPQQFKLRTQVNSYTFKAPSVDAAEDWISALQLRIGLASRLGDDEEQRLADLIEAPPKWMIDWDKNSDVDNVILVQEKLSSLFFQRGGGGGVRPTLEHTLSCVTLLMEELEDKARECLPLNGQLNAKTESGRSESRPDIFQVILRFYHIRIVDELSQYVSLDQAYDSFSLRELLSCMDLISAYHTKLGEIFQGDVGRELETKIPPFGMMDNAENMATVYRDKCELQITAWVDNVTETSSRKVEVRTDGKFQTTSPALLLNLLNEALVLAKRSGMKRLQTELLALCAVSVGDFMHATVGSLHKSTSGFSYAVACANDCWSVMDYIENFLKAQTNDEYDVNFLALEEKSAAEADRCLAVVAGMVHDDLAGVLKLAFTNKHFESTTVQDDVMAVVCATCDDYLESFCVMLEQAFVIRLARMMMASVVAAYLARLGQAYRDEGLGSRGGPLTKKQVELIKLDRDRLTECLQTRLPRFSCELVAPEFGALDDVLDMLTSPLVYIPQTAAKLVEHNDALREHVREIAKMMVDLSPQQHGADQAREIKAMIDPELARIPANPAVAAVDADHALVKMWPLKSTKKAAAAAAAGGVNGTLSRADSRAQMATEVKPVQKLSSATSDLRMTEVMRKQQSVQWALPTKQSALVEQTVSLQAQLQYTPSAQMARQAHLVVVRRCQDGTEHELVVYESAASATGPIVFLCRMSDISRVEFCEAASNGAVTPMLVMEDGKSKKDAIAFSRTANAKNEFSVIKKQDGGAAAHFLVGDASSSKTATTAAKWVKELQLRMQESFNRGSAAPAPVPAAAVAAAAPKPVTKAAAAAAPVVVVVTETPSMIEQENYADMSTKQLKELARLRKLDTSRCVERNDIIAVLEESDGGSIPPPPAAAAAPPVSALRKTSTATAPQQPEPAKALAGKKTSTVKFAPAAAAAVEEPAAAAAPAAVAPVVVVAAAPVVAEVPKPAPAGAAIPAAAPVAAAAPLANLLDSNEEKIIEIQMLIFQGHALVEDGNPKEAVPLFKKAKDEAERINDTQLKAKASTGLASAYRDMPQMRRAAAPLFEVAATLFGSTGDTSDRINVLGEAADIYVSQGEYAQAVRCLTRFDRAMVQAGSLPIFAARIREIQDMM